MNKTFTNKSVAGIKSKSKPFEVADAGCRGLSLRVTPNNAKSFYARYRMPDGTQSRYRIGDADKISVAQAREKLAELVGAVAIKGNDPVQERRDARNKKNSHTLGSFLNEVYGPWLIENKRTGKQTASLLKSVFAGLLPKKLDELTPWMIEQWRRPYVKDGRIPAANRYVTYLRAGLSRAAQWGYLKENPLASVKRLQEDAQGRIRYLEPDEEKRLMDALDAREERMRTERDSANEWRRERNYDEWQDLHAVAYADHLKPMALIALNTGIRRGELFSLTWQDVDFQTTTLTIRGATAKAGVTRRLPINSVALEVFKQWRAQTDGGDLAFPSKNGTRFDNVNSAWRAILAEAKITDFHWHDMRHCFASKLVMAGVDLNTVRELLGHGDIKMTLRYAHLSPTAKAKAVELIVQPANVVTLQRAEGQRA